VRAILDEIGIEWRGFNRCAGAIDTARWLAEAGFCDTWAWLSAEPVVFDEHGELVDYLLGGALLPYLAYLQASERRSVAETVARRLDSQVLEFVRLNVLARRVR
jgi:hypothetical protein